MTERTDQSKTIPIKPVDEPSGIPRREALQSLLGTVGAGFALTSVVEAQHPVHQHLASPAIVEKAQQNAAVAAYAPEFLDAHQLKTLESVAEAIVPGSTTARVAPFLDQLLAVESPTNQARIRRRARGVRHGRHREGWQGVDAPSRLRSRMRSCATPRRPTRSRRCEATSRTSRTGSPGRTTHQSKACASWGGRGTCSLRSCRAVRTRAGMGRELSSPQPVLLNRRSGDQEIRRHRVHRGHRALRDEFVTVGFVGWNP